MEVMDNNIIGIIIHPPLTIKDRKGEFSSKAEISYPNIEEK